MILDDWTKPTPPPAPPDLSEVPDAQVIRMTYVEKTRKRPRFKGVRIKLTPLFDDNPDENSSSWKQAVDNYER